MSDLTLSFDTDSAAFADNAGPAEAARILRNVAARLERGATDGVLRDINGNRVGSWSVSFEADDDSED